MDKLVRGSPMATHIWDCASFQWETVQRFMAVFRFARKEVLTSHHPSITMAMAFGCYVLERDRQMGGRSETGQNVWNAASRNGHRWFRGRNLENYKRGGHRLLRHWLSGELGDLISPDTNAQRLYTSFWDYFDETTYLMLFDEIESIGLRPEREEWGL